MNNYFRYVYEYVMDKVFVIAAEEANEQRKETKCFKCKELDYHARDCDEASDTTSTSWEIDVKVPEVAKHFYLE